jgi:hypothetical protein
MRTLILAAVTALFVDTAAAQESKNFRDWAIGCDNLRSCTALGVTVPDSGGPYVKITRDGAAEAEPEVTFVAYADDQTKDATLALAVDPPAPGLPVTLPAKSDGSFLRATLTGEAARDAIGALGKGKTLAVTVVGAPAGDASDPPAAISLSGVTATLLYMDDFQGRVGTVTALQSPGAGDATTLPEIPREPEIPAVKMTELKEPPPGAPKEKNEDCIDGVEPIVVQLSPGLVLAGACVNSGAYNYDYEFVLVEGGKTRPVTFEVPKGIDPVHNALTNPALSEDGLTISQFAKGRGIGDCGVLAAWAYDGSAFRLANYRAWDGCNGVYSDDWPVLYVAKVK